MTKIITIEQLDAGFIVSTNETKSAISSLEGLFKKIKQIYGITERLHCKKSDISVGLNPKTIEISKCVTTPDSTITIPVSTIPCSVVTELIPFKEVSTFEVSKSQIPQQFGKTDVYIVNDNVILYGRQYHTYIYTTLEELKRIKLLSEMNVKLMLQDYEKRTYPTKGVVLRHFLRDLKDISMLKAESKKQIPTYSTLKEIDDLKKGSRID